MQLKTYLDALNMLMTACETDGYSSGTVVKLRSVLRELLTSEYAIKAETSNKILSLAGAVLDRLETVKKSDADMGDIGEDKNKDTYSQSVKYTCIVKTDLNIGLNMRGERFDSKLLEVKRVLLVSPFAKQNERVADMFAKKHGLRVVELKFSDFKTESDKCADKFEKLLQFMNQSNNTVLFHFCEMDGFLLPDNALQRKLLVNCMLSVKSENCYLVVSSINYRDLSFAREIEFDGFIAECPSFSAVQQLLKQYNIQLTDFPEVYAKIKHFNDCDWEKVSAKLASGENFHTATDEPYFKGATRIKEFLLDTTFDVLQTDSGFNPARGDDDDEDLLPPFDEQRLAALLNPATYSRHGRKLTEMMCGHTTGYILSQNDFENWKRMAPSQRLAAFERAYEYLATIMHIPLGKLTFDCSKKGAGGVCFTDKGNIAMLPRYINNADDMDHAMFILFHECYHAVQGVLIYRDSLTKLYPQLYENFDREKYLEEYCITEAIVTKWKDELEHYIDLNENFKAYSMQSVELTANEFAENCMQAFSKGIM